MARGTDRARRFSALLPEARRLLSTHGATAIWLFGSLAMGSFHETSDVDLAVQGLPPASHIAALADLMALFSAPVDLVRLEDAPVSLVDRVHAEGVQL